MIKPLFTHWQYRNGPRYAEISDNGGSYEVFVVVERLWWCFWYYAEPLHPGALLNIANYTLVGEDVVLLPRSVSRIVIKLQRR